MNSPKSTLKSHTCDMLIKVAMPPQYIYILSIVCTQIHQKSVDDSLNLANYCTIAHLDWDYGVQDMVGTEEGLQDLTGADAVNVTVDQHQDALENSNSNNICFSFMLFLIHHLF